MTTPQTIKTLLEGHPVRIVQLKQNKRRVSGTQGFLRDPVVGEEGEVTALEPSIEPTHITVEKIENGQLVWSAVFTPDELERV